MSYLASLRDRELREKHDAVDDLPSYPAQGGAEDEDEGEAPLIQKKEKGNGQQGQSVDDFSYQLGRLHHDLRTLESNLAGIPSLRDDTYALAPGDNSLVAQSLLQDLIAQTAASADPLSRLPSELRTLSSRVHYLKPGAGQFVVSSKDVNQVQTELAATASLLKQAIKQVEEGARYELDGEQHARVRLLKIIRATTTGLDDAGQMALLISAVREGQAFPEQLKAGSASWRWSVEHPFRPLQAALSSSGDLSFLQNIKAPDEPAPSLWSNPLSYVPSLSRSSRPPSYAAPGDTASTVDGRDVDDEDKVGSYGESLHARPRKQPSRYAVAFTFIVLLAVIAGSAVGIVLWSRHRQDPVGGETETSSSAAASATSSMAAAHIGGL
ncbi:hypothetical protein JCM8547_006143 [Rhodosporidiobolus lusitaniae]